MSIAGKCIDVKVTDTSAHLVINGEYGLQTLVVNNPTTRLKELVGHTIWGGDGYLILSKPGHKDERIADRVGYSRITMTGNWA